MQKYLRRNKLNIFGSLKYIIKIIDTTEKIDLSVIDKPLFRRYASKQLKKKRDIKRNLFLDKIKRLLQNNVWQKIKIITGNTLLPKI